MKPKYYPASLFRSIVLLFIRIDGICAMASGKAFKRKYRIIGECKQCGQCCTQLAIYLSDGFWQIPWLVNLAIRWCCFIYNFEFIEKEESLKVLLFKCNYLKNNLCSIYTKRPPICRYYPLPRYFEKPVFLPGCGFDCELNI